MSADYNAEKEPAVLRYESLGFALNEKGTPVLVVIGVNPNILVIHHKGEYKQPTPPAEIKLLPLLDIEVEAGQFAKAHTETEIFSPETTISKTSLGSVCYMAYRRLARIDQEYPEVADYTRLLSTDKLNKLIAETVTSPNELGTAFRKSEFSDIPLVSDHDAQRYRPLPPVPALEAA